MEQNDAVERFRHLQQRYEDEHGHGAALQLKDELGLGSGMFNDRLSVEELEDLNRELEDKLARPAE